MLITVKSREVQRGMLAEMSGNQAEASQHFLAAAHLELVLAADYDQAGEPELARRSRISAASSFWRTGKAHEAQALFNSLTQADPARAGEIKDVLADLSASTP
jgi:hypothetical protein